MRHCSVCKREVNEQEAPILAMGGFGNPKYLCTECAEDVDTVIGAKDPEEIELAMAKISRNLSDSDADDPLVLETVNEIFSAAGERARKIKDGTYDFSEDEEKEEGLLDVPEELRETEEDRALDEKDKKEEAFYNKIFNWVYFVVFLAAIILALILILSK